MAVAVAIVAFAAAPALAQWPAYTAAGVPRTADGTVDLDAPPPHAADGHIDLSGVWETSSPRRPGARAGVPGGQAGALPPAGAPRTAPPAGARGTGNVDPLSRNVFGNIGAQTESGTAPYQPWAADLVKARMADNSKDNPDAHCLPMGVMQLTAHPYPKKIIQTPSEVVLIYEGSGTTVREVYLDGRALPSKDADPWWNGYSVGHWDGDTLVVETSAFMDDGWLDVRGSPLTSEGKLIERYHRPSYGALDIAVTIDDPKAYTKPFTATVHNRLLVDSQLIEFVCIDKDAQHYVGAHK
jgi:hypothetical protein